MLLGDPGAGKSALCLKLNRDLYMEEYTPTGGMELHHLPGSLRRAAVAPRILEHSGQASVIPDEFSVAVAVSARDVVCLLNVGVAWNEFESNHELSCIGRGTERQAIGKLSL